jgi:hypothetical protein
MHLRMLTFCKFFRGQTYDFHFEGDAILRQKKIARGGHREKGRCYYTSEKWEGNVRVQGGKVTKGNVREGMEGAGNVPNCKNSLLSVVPTDYRSASNKNNTRINLAELKLLAD